MKEWNVYFQPRDSEQIVRIRVKAEKIVDAILTARENFSQTFKTDAECIRATISTKSIK